MKAVRTLVGENSQPGAVVDRHESFNGVQTHENGVFLYQSNLAAYALKLGYADYVTLGYFFGYAFVHPCFLLPSLVSCLFVPRRITMTKYFTWHAELLPHTE